MHDLLTNSGLLLDQAERMHVLALGESDKKKQRVMLAIAEHYYLLHDRLVELERLVSPQSAALVAANSA